MLQFIPYLGILYDDIKDPENEILSFSNKFTWIATAIGVILVLKLLFEGTIGKEEIHGFIIFNPIVGMINYKIVEHKSKGSFKRLANLRKTKSRKVIDELHEPLLKLERESLPRSGLGKAINYTLNLWRVLTEFISDAKIPLTNNLAERVLRNPVKGRDNYLGYRTINGADVAMFYYSIIETCKLLRINPRAYLIEQSERHWEKKKLQTPLEWAKSQA